MCSSLSSCWSGIVGSTAAEFTDGEGGSTAAEFTDGEGGGSTAVEVSDGEGDPNEGDIEELLGGDEGGVVYDLDAW